MPNTIVTNTLINREVLRGFVNSITFAKNISRTYDDSFAVRGAKIGDTVKALLPHRAKAVRGAALQPADILDQTVPISITDQVQYSLSYTSRERTLDLDDIRARYIQPAADAMANEVDVICWSSCYKDVYSAIGTPGTAPATALEYLLGGVKLTDLSVQPEDRIACLDPYAMAVLANAASTLFNPQTAISENWRKGMFGRNQLGVSEWYQDPNRSLHTTGTFTASTPVVGGALQTGSTLATTGWAAGASTLRAGDIFTIAGVYSVNRLSYQSTGRLQQFVVTADTADAGGAMATLPISPAIITSGPLQTVSNSPAAGAAITVLGATSSVAGTLATTNSPQGMLFVKEAFALVSADLFKPSAGCEATVVSSPQFGMSIRMIEQYDIRDDEQPTRLDLLAGAATVQAHKAVRIFS